MDIQFAAGLFSAELMMALVLGVALSAACGLRLFVPPLMLSMAALYFDIPLPHELAWLGSFPAFFILLTATLVETAAYYIPLLDHALDVIATPLAIISGTLLTSSFMGDVDPAMKWSIALIAGGGAAGTVQSLTNTSRLASLATTMGVANPIVATVENILAVLVSGLTIWLPATGLFLMTFLLVGIVWMVIVSLRRCKKAVNISR